MIAKRKKKAKKQQRKKTFTRRTVSLSAQADRKLCRVARRSFRGNVSAAVDACIDSY